MTNWPSLLVGALMMFAGDQLWVWWKGRGKPTPPVPAWLRRRKARQDAPWDRALERNRSA